MWKLPCAPQELPLPEMHEGFDAQAAIFMSCSTAEVLTGHHCCLGLPVTASPVCEARRRGPWL